MKAYTDIEQSKKLAEIIPLESADMVFTFSIKEDTYVPDKYPSYRKYSELYKEFVSLGFTKEHIENLICPCWSLAALLEVLPNNKHITTSVSRGGWKIEPVEYLDNWWCEYEDDSHTKDFTVSADNPVDACVEMILKLHELKML